MNVLDFFLLSIVAALPFGTRVLLGNFSGAGSAQGEIFLYGLDILISSFLFWFLLRRENYKARVGRGEAMVLGVFAFSAFFSLFLAESKPLALYAFIRLAILVGFSLTASVLLLRRKVFEWALALMVVLALFESSIGILQFRTQGSVGFQRLGEPHLTLADPSIARAVVEEGRVIRAYGTFPHPNVLAAFLLMGLIALYYFWFSVARESMVWSLGESPKKFFRRYAPIFWHSIFLGPALFVVLAGLALTFSRTAWAIALFISLFLISYFLFLSQYRRQAFKLFVVLVTSSLLLVTVLFPFISHRFSISATEPSVVQRLIYNRIGWEIVKTHPFGVGIGNEVIYAVGQGLYQKFGITKSLLHQPTHNIYLLMASEIGILGLAAFLWFIGTLVISGLKHWESADRLPLVISYLLLVSLLLFGFIDHFVWDIPQGEIMFWLIVGMMLSVRHSTNKEVN